MGRAGVAPAMRLPDAAILQTVAYANRRADPGKRRRGQDSNLQWVTPCFLSREVPSTNSATSPDSPKEI